jgi:hypothetical protein
VGVEKIRRRPCDAFSLSPLQNNHIVASRFLGSNLEGRRPTGMEEVRTFERSKDAVDSIPGVGQNLTQIEMIELKGGVRRWAVWDAH